MMDGPYVLVTLATDADVLKMTGSVDNVPPCKGLLDSWRLIAIRWPEAGEITCHAVGTNADRYWVTSAVHVISHDRRYIRTHNSLYQLGEASQGDPSLDLLVAVANALAFRG